MSIMFTMPLRRGYTEIFLSEHFMKTYFTIVSLRKLPRNVRDMAFCREEDNCPQGSYPSKNCFPGNFSVDN